MIVLGLETSTAVCAAAVVEDGVVRAEATVVERHVHAERLLLQVEQVLRDAGTGLRDVAGIAVSIGPGSFTGLRIGLSVAKGLVYAGSMPIVGVPTLQALAQRLPDAGARAPCILAALDARRDEVYAQLFAVRDARAVPLCDVRDMTTDELFRASEGEEILLTGDARQKLEAKLRTFPAEFRERFRFADPELSRCSAASVALGGEQLLKQGRSDDPGSLEPRYIKEFFLKTR